MHTVESFYVLSEKHVNIQQVFWMTFSQHGNKDTNHKTLLVLDKGEGGREGQAIVWPKKGRQGRIKEARLAV